MDTDLESKTDTEDKILAAEIGTRMIDPWKLARILVIVLVTPVALYYLWTRGFIYFNFNREVYTDYFWYRAPWLLAHIVCGIVATLIGPLQFIRAVRERNPLLHRTFGKAYIGSITISTIISFYLVSTSQLGLAYATGLAFLGVAWLVTTWMAYFSIRKKNMQMHKEWMIKSYVLTLAFVSFRTVEDILVMMGLGDFVDRKILMAWGCWAVPFLATEVILQARKLAR